MSYHARVIEERNQLIDKIVKLADFIGNNVGFNDLPDIEKESLRIQLKAMLHYCDILIERINRLK